ncbi:aldehyde dehydrogenase family protein [Thermaerobacter sp. PB12/4term]|uniref:aldehyde dehydrogenase family protein n=1 Tax=Thermaerobacter sp. PB12/4term TaxID=2293838 RepID=UPI0013141ACC|nr:aldehyde dehydrogenase family protein [Thermaerobacter sp. PB12/4term]QIA27393.1 aldehyde dehydrogenase family protein [Thermaerobacter sp. PB12/4term]
MQPRDPQGGAPGTARAAPLSDAAAAPGPAPAGQPSTGSPAAGLAAASGASAIPAPAPPTGSTGAAGGGPAPAPAGWTPVAEIPAVVARARAAFPAWAQLPVRERVACVARLRRYIVRHRDELARVISAGTGKPLVEALVHDLLTTADALKSAEKLAPRVLRRQRQPMSLLLFGKIPYVERKPYGCVLVVAPWNYPFNLAVVPAATALLAGNTVILKPTEVTPGISRAIEEAFFMAGFPPGVVQVVHGGAEVGQAVLDAGPDFVFFTGSTATGRRIASAAAQRLTPSVLELGGKDPMIVFPDADLARAARAAVWGSLANCGQTCIGVERIYVHEAVKDRFVDRVLDELARLRRAEPEGTGGDPARVAADPDLDLGLMTTPRQVAIVREHVQDALARGARALTPVPSFEGRFVPPVVLVDVDPQARVMREETFGPVIAIAGFRSADEAVRLANDSPFGLGASVWTRNGRLAREIASRLEAGGVCINDVIIHFAHPALPFGGVKESGWGAYHGRAGLEAFTYPSAVLVEPGWLAGKLVSSLLWYPYRRKYRLFSWFMRVFCG